ASLSDLPTSWRGVPGVVPRLPRDVGCGGIEKRGRARALQRSAARVNRSMAVPPLCFASVGMTAPQ
ncbi:MAG TPA: hypothetical protein PLV39_11115, partial [Fimbriimonadaceae bacterium]|nr:hypothetical protein [Fimbriimonadaceae bacterium]